MLQHDNLHLTAEAGYKPRTLQRCKSDLTATPGSLRRLCERCLVAEPEPCFLTKHLCPLPQPEELLLLYLLLRRRGGSWRTLPLARQLVLGPWESPINLLLGGDKASSRMFPARLCFGLGAARGRTPWCCQVQRRTRCLKTSCVLLRAPSEPKGFAGLQISTARLGQRFCPRSGCS